ncbi:MAG: hypothetical protein FJ139_07250 [Deltaproteobacteria bacterium]|nr:hypothetical protein [Deltaproteobacteria bacterium]
MVKNAFTVKGKRVALAGVFMIVSFLLGWIETGLSQEGKYDLNTLAQETLKTSEKQNEDKARLSIWQYALFLTGEIPDFMNTFPVEMSEANFPCEEGSCI